MMDQFYFFEFPDGSTFKARNLNEGTFESLKDQCHPREILRIENGTGNFQLYHKHTILHGNKQTFSDDHGAHPTPGRYKVVLKENNEEIYEFAFCGSHLIILGNQDPSRQARQILGPDSKLYMSTLPTAAAKYSISVVRDRLVVSLDFDAEHFSRLMTVKNIVEVSQWNGGGSIGSIPGQIYLMASLIPFGTLQRVLIAFEATAIYFTGKGWSGAIAHAAAIIFREMMSSVSEGLFSVKAISFNGPLCANAEMTHYLDRKGQKENHTTINTNSDVLDRLLMDYQRLSPLEKCDVDSWRFIFATLNVDLKMYHTSIYPRDIALMDLAQLSQAEMNLDHHVAITTETRLLPIGRYVFRNALAENDIATEDTAKMAKLTTLDGKSLSGKKVAYTLEDISSKFVVATGTTTSTTQPSMKGRTSSSSMHSMVDCSLNFTPKITNFSIIWTTQRVTVNFVGENLDSVLSRHLLDTSALSSLPDGEKGSGSSSLDSIMPFRLLSGGQVNVSPQAKLLSVTATWDKVVVDLTGVELPSTGEICLRTDFGESNGFRFTENHFVKGVESAPSRSLHPTMNAEFLSSSFLRVAIYCHKNSSLEALNNNQQMRNLWRLILDLERDLAGDKFPITLESNLMQYLNNEIDIGVLRNMSLGSFEMMARRAVEEYTVKENRGVKFTRKAIGGLAKVGGGIVALVGLILSIPAVLLALPLTMAMQRHQSTGMARQIGVGVYGATVAIVSLPAVIVGLIGSFLIYAGEYAASDYQSTQYKQMLKSLLLQLGGSPLAVLDELPLLEDSVLLQFSLLYPSCDLTWCSSEAILAVIEEGIKNENEMSIQLKKFLSDCPIFLDKLRHVGRIHAIRNLLENSIMIGFTGVHNAGKSTTIKHLFGVETGADIVVRTEEPVPHALGQWMNTCAEKHPVFEQWLSCTPSQHQREFQLYAVDFPGTTDERLSVGTITKYTAELASMFVVMLKAGHIAGPEKEVVNVAKANHKPFLVVINQCDTIAHELSKPSNFERIKDSYAKVLDIPEQQLLFVSAFDPTHVDRLRGFIFATIRNLMGNPSDYRTLPLQFIPDKIAHELDVRYPEPSIFNIADRLSEAATSLLCNFSPITAVSLGERALLFNQNVISAMQAAKESLESGGGTALVDTLNNQDAVDTGVNQGVGSILNELRHLAVVLNIETDVYGALVDVITVTFDFVSESLENANDAQLGAGEENKEAVKAAIIALVTLMAVHSRINSYFGGNQPVASPSDKIDKLCREVLLGMNSIFATWLSRGYRSDAIRATIKTILTDNGESSAFDDAAFLHSLTEVTSALDMQHAFQASTRGANPAVSTIDDDLAMIRLSFQSSRPMLERSASSAARLNCLAEVNSYQRAKDFVKQLRAMSFATFPSHSALQLNEACSEDIADFQLKLATLVKRHTVAEVMEVPAENYAVNMIERLKFLTAEHFERCDLKFRIAGEAAIDMNGVTCSLLTKAAAEINEHPEIVMMRKDGDSGLLYFDPAACSSNDPVVITKARDCYMGLGRLVGLSLRKSFAGATFPVAFPITVYKCLLGMQIGLADLQIISPQVSNTIHQICTMEGSDLEASDLFFSISLPAPERSSAAAAHGPKDIELEPSGRFRQVTLDNRIDYLHQLLKVYLCAKSPATGPALGGLHGATATLLLTDFLLGVQHLCPRDMFNKLSPVALQLLVEGNAAIDVDEWQAHTEVRSDSTDGLETAMLFWQVLKEMDTTDRKRLLCFAVGTASLPAKGFADLSPKFSLNIGGSLSEEALPVSHTCFHMLCLPRYKSETVLRDKLLQAIRETDVASLGII